MPRLGTRLRGLAAVCLLFAAAGCADDGDAGDAGFDGDSSFIAGDAEPAPDAVVLDVGDAAPDAGVPEDAAPSDASEDAGEADAGTPDADPCLAPTVATLAASAAPGRADVLAGEVVELTGTATAAALECTDRACPEDDPCCNTCTARIRVGDVYLRGSACFSVEPACTGDECNQTCRPPLFGLPQTFRGVLSTAAPDLELLLYEVR